MGINKVTTVTLSGVNTVLVIKDGTFSLELNNEELANFFNATPEEKFKWVIGQGEIEGTRLVDSKQTSFENQATTYDDIEYEINSFIELDEDTLDSLSENEEQIMEYLNHLYDDLIFDDEEQTNNTSEENTKENKEKTTEEIMQEMLDNQEWINS